MKNIVKMAAIASLVAVQLNAVPLVENAEFIQAPVLSTQIKEKSIVPVLAQVSKTVAWTVTTVIAALSLHNTRTSDGNWGITGTDKKHEALKYAANAGAVTGIALMVGNVIANIASTVKKIQDYRETPAVQAEFIAE